jgi:hypothetical protein
MTFLIAGGRLSIQSDRATMCWKELDIQDVNGIVALSFTIHGNLIGVAQASLFPRE